MVEPARILMLLPEAPIPFGGAAARWYYAAVKGLHERGHQLTTFIADGDKDRQDAARQLFSAPGHDLRFFTPDLPAGLAGKMASLRRPYSHSYSKELRRTLERELAVGFDVLHLEHPWSGYLGLGHRSKALLHSHCLQALDLAGITPRRIKDRVLTTRALAMEAWLIRQFPYQSALTPELKHHISKVNPQVDCGLVPLPLDLSLYPYCPDGCRTARKRLILIGSMHWVPTQLAAVRLLTRLWPKIQQQRPDLELEITGWTASSFLADFASTAGVRIHSDVKNIGGYFDRGTVFVYPPPQGSGMKVKVMEAMAFGVPVVTTPPGIEGLEVVPGVHAEVATSDDDLIAAILRLVSDEDRQNHLRQAARRLLEERYTADRSLEALEQRYGVIRAGANRG